MPEEKRAAILSSNFEGVKSLVAEGGESVTDFLNKHKQTFIQAHKKYSGNIVQYFEGAVHSTFDSASDALQCAITIHSELADDPLFAVRTGIHYGDFEIEDNDIMGEAVLITSRIEKLAMAGSILISKEFCDEVKDLGDRKVFMGAFELKKIEDPVKIYAIKADGIYLPTNRELKIKNGEVPGFGKKKLPILTIIITLILLAAIYFIWRSFA